VSIEIANESGTEVDTDSILAVARYALDEMGVNPLAELSVLLVDSEYMAELNHRWMGGDGPTDVLAFPMDEGSIDHGPGESPGGEPALLGDIVLAPQVAAKQCRRRSGVRSAERLPARLRRYPGARVVARNLFVVDGGPHRGRRAAPVDRARGPAPARLRPCRA